MWRPTQWNALLGMSLRIRRGSSLVDQSRVYVCVCVYVCVGGCAWVCVSHRQTISFVMIFAASSAAESPDSCIALLCFLLCLLFFCYLPPHLSFLFPLFSSSLFSSSCWPSLGESSVIWRVCPAPHSSAASEECLVHQLQQLSSSSMLISPLLLLLEEQPVVIFCLYRCFELSVNYIINKFKHFLSFA